MKNRELAKILYEIADFLEIQEEQYKPQAYRKAARNVESLSEDIEDVYERGELEQIEGVGESISAKIQEYLDTGELTYYEELRADLPIDIDAITSVEGVGPKTAKKLYFALGVAALEDLVDEDLDAAECRFTVEERIDDEQRMDVRAMFFGQSEGDLRGLFCVFAPVRRDQNRLVRHHPGTRHPPYSTLSSGGESRHNIRTRSPRTVHARTTIWYIPIARLGTESFTSNSAKISRLGFEAEARIRARHPRCRRRPVPEFPPDRPIQTIWGRSAASSFVFALPVEKRVSSAYPRFLASGSIRSKN